MHTFCVVKSGKIDVGRFPLKCSTPLEHTCLCVSQTWDADSEANCILQELEKERVQEESLAKKFPAFGPGDSLELKLVRTSQPPFPSPP